MKFLLPVVLLLTLSCTVATGQNKDVKFIVTSGNEIRVEKDNLVAPSSDRSIDFIVDTSDKRQTIRGFGGAFNEQGWAALLTLDEETRLNVLRSIFDPNEANFSWGRIPIGASDYALERYTLAPVPGDFEMQHFTIERDKKYLIPYIKAALTIHPDLMLWGSAWSPPIWMKDNGNYEGGNFIDKKEYYAAYALYLAKFVEEYAKEGITISAVAVQNEPTVVTGYPNGGWKPEQFRKFIRDYAGPLFKQRSLKTAIWLGTLNEGDYSSYAKTVLDDPEAKKYVGAVALQWDGDKQIPSIKRYHPDMPIIQSETDCGNWHWKPGFNKDTAPNDFTYAAYTWGRIRDYLSAGAEAYMLWNIVLDQNGKNIDKRLPWPQNSAIVVNTDSKEVIYTPMFRAFEHFSRFVPKDSVVLGTKGSMKDVLAFQDTSGNLVIELMNDRKSTKTLRGKIGENIYSITLPPESFATLIVEHKGTSKNYNF